VAEYGITVRWDKNFLDLNYILLMRRKKFRLLDGVRFGDPEPGRRLGAGLHHWRSRRGGRPTLCP